MLKYNLSLLALLSFAFEAWPQSIPSPQFSYQAVVRQADGRLKKNSPVTLVISLRPSQGGTPIWRETHNALTDGFGVVALEIGKGPNQITGPTQFSNVNFGTGDFWLKIQLSSASGPLVADQKLMSVPYAAYARTSGNTFPPGTIVAFGGDTSKIPKGWLLCDGRIFSVNAVDGKSGIPMSGLYQAIGTTWGAPSGGFFELPDMRGAFLRGVDMGRGLDPDAATRDNSLLHSGANSGDAVGSGQRPQMQAHNHIHGYGGYANNSQYGWVAGATTTLGHHIEGAYSMHPYTSTTGGSETRPVNLGVHYIIKL